ncbi:retrotransposon protein, putative, ty1-copia subclass [Tanacetum coccineum]
MLAELRKMFEKPPAVEIYDLVDALHSCKQAPGSSLSPLPRCWALEEELSSYPNKDQACHHCQVAGHWKRNCPLYIEELHANKKKSEPGAAVSGNLFAIELFNLTYKLNSWVYDTGCGIHVCNTLQGFKEERKLSYGDQYLQVGNGTQAAVEAIGMFDLVLPSGLVLKLNNCYYAPSIVRGVVSLSCLLDLGFHHTIASNGISVSLNGIFYFSAISVNGVFEIDMNNNVPKNNNNSIFSINKKRKLDLDSYCRLAHIGKTRMQKLHREDLLGLIHTDVCGPLRHVSRKGASYFLTFTDDFSRYGYVYLLKHKHEVFETFKVFKAEVELQLGKKIKALRSDRGGEYLSQEFKDYLSENGIVQNLTSPYTPQQNGVSERRNRTLLDMVRSMFNLTTLPLSFWDYALESAVRILNMVPTKKVDKTPYEIWHGKAPNLSYLKDHPKETMVEDDVVDRPPNAKVVRSKWIFKKKTDMDGKVHTYKARLVAKGCTQTYGIDYEETFSHVTDIRAIRILIAIADEDIIWSNLKGMLIQIIPNGVCKLQRAIYGLKQASRQWNKRFDEEIKRFGFIQNRDEPCVYRKASGSDVVFLILYVDDILIMGNNIPKLKEVKDYLGKCFSVKDLGEAAYILGIKIYRDRSLRLIGLNQSAYIDKILKKFNMQNSKKGFIPMEVKHDLSNEMCASSDEEKAYMKKVPYASAVGSIMYAVRCTRPDVAFAQNLVSRYQQNPGKLHWVAVKHILKYLRNTKDMFLVYGGNPDTELDVTGFCDASWQCDKDDTKSQTGYVFIVNGGAVDWKSKKQTTIAMHATQSEYMAASEAAMEAVWIRKFVGDLGVMPSINKPINMYCDNSAAIIFANEPGVMKGARHFLRRYHYVREQVESGEIKLIKVHTDKNLADAFTKALPRGKVNEHANGIGLRLASSFMHICKVTEKVMDRLGEGEICSIFERISNEEDKKSFALVCKLFLRVACFHLRSLHTESPDLLFDMLIASPKMFTFECHKPFSNNHMKLIAESGPNIEQLDLSKWRSLDHEMYKLEFDDVGLVAIANSCSHLVNVNLSGRLRFNEIGIGSLVRSCKNLRYLWLNYCVNVTDKSLKMIGAATRLEELDLRGCNMISDLGLEYLADGKLKHCLDKLYLNGCDRITDNGIVIHLKKLVSLRILGLSRCGANITDYGVVALCELPNLEMLHLDFLINITDISLREIGSKCLKMLLLSLMGCNRITSVGLQALSDLHRLLSLTLVKCYKLSWEEVRSTVLSCQNMRYLYLSRSIKKPMPDPDFKELYRVSGNKFCNIIWK